MINGVFSMILFVYLLLYSLAVQSQINDCSSRCNRIHQRTLERTSMNKQQLMTLLEARSPLRQLKDMCWRVYDYLDCMHKCPNDKEHEIFAKIVKSRCRFVLKDMESRLNCISRYHSFLEIRCSTFIKEAVQRKIKLDEDMTPDEATCRFLHLNSLCLENTVGNYCPTAHKIFRRLNLRDYFLSFILPENDELFDDIDLDSCQIYDFVKLDRTMLYDDDSNEMTTTVSDNSADKDESMTSTMNPLSSSTSILSDNQANGDELNSLMNKVLDDIEDSDLITNKTSLFSQPINTSIERHEKEEDEEEEKEKEKKDNKSVEEDEYDEDDNNEGDVIGNDERIHVVPILTRSKEYTSTISSNIASKGGVFSDDSLESNPPNFYYSSLRSTTQYTTKIGEFEVTTIMAPGFFRGKTGNSDEDNEDKTVELLAGDNDYMDKDNISQNSTLSTLLVTPLINGNVRIRPILPYSSLIHDNEGRLSSSHNNNNNTTHDDNDDDISMILKGTESSAYYDGIILSDKNLTISIDISSPEQNIVIIYCLILATSLFILLMTLIFCVWCKKNASYTVNKR